MLQHSGDEENQNTQDQSALPSSENYQAAPLLEQKEKVKEEAKSWTHWFKVPAFYLYGTVYMGVRMLVNVQSVRIKRITLLNN